MGKLVLWVHGHMHDSLDYRINGTRVVYNPRGYCRYSSSKENNQFSTDFMVEI